VKSWRFTTWVAIFPLARTATVPGRHGIVLCMISQYAVKLAKQSIQLAGWPDLKQLVLVCVYYNQLGSNQSCQKTQQTQMRSLQNATAQEQLTYMISILILARQRYLLCNLLNAFQIFLRARRIQFWAAESQHR